MTRYWRYLPLRCTDLDRAVAFYTDVLGLTTTRYRPGEFIQLDVGGAELCVDLAHDETATPAAILAVDDLKALADRLTRHGSTIVDGGIEKGWLQVADPDGNHLVFERARRAEATSLTLTATPAQHAPAPTG